MRPLSSSVLAAVIAISAVGSASADDTPVSGTWIVHGKISAFQFTLTCRFEQKGQSLGGTCYDGGTNKPHPLTRGEVSGDHVSWTYQSSYLFKTFDATYSGTLSGASIKGVATAPGHEGNFTAEKQP